MAAWHCLRGGSARFPTPLLLFPPTVAARAAISPGSINVSTASWAGSRCVCGLPIVQARQPLLYVEVRIGRCPRGIGRAARPRSARIARDPRPHRLLLPAGACLPSWGLPMPGRCVRRAAQGSYDHEPPGPMPEPGASQGAASRRCQPRLLMPIARTLLALGVERALVVHGSGLDEVALHGFTRAISLRAGIIEEIEIEPEQAGLERVAVERDYGRNAGGERSASVRPSFRHRRRRDAAIVSLNAGALLMTAGKASSLREGSTWRSAPSAMAEPMPSSRLSSRLSHG